MQSAFGNPLRGIAFKVASVVVFLGMQTFIKLGGTNIAPGQVTFYRSFFALFPIMAYLAYRGQLKAAFYTANPIGHLKRGTIGIVSMGFGFYGLLHLPLPEAIALGYAMPLVAVIFAAVFLGETVRIYRWSAVFFGMVGVAIVSWPKLTLFRQGGMEAEQAVGAICVLIAAVLGGMAMIQVRKLVEEERTATIVLYFSIIASLFSLATLPFGWASLELRTVLLLVAAGFCGGVAQILLTESYRHAEVSTVAPFEYTSILLGGIVGYFVFGDVPGGHMMVGTAIVIAAGIFIIYREHQLGLERRRARQAGGPKT
ncbi:DMT family transporter [Rhizobium sp. P32RR-XVIII]|uniref:DMT family transporter n=1 Tax=Rhizobium sp. P32RR-XVIII TaxID=2726738 RepID=UPI001457707A|nr:DMT family transporter [Rhizobium sp. P32RR-XVIII]NLS02888.1 DMT family transporter [Rhizobium sp. P32RR-XVIII]